MTNQDAQTDAQTQEILNELKEAYKSINALQKTPTHRKIAIELEQKIRKEQKEKAQQK